MKCPYCDYELTETGNSLWCESCVYGESLVYPGRLLQNDKRTGLAEAVWAGSREGKQIMKHRLKIVGEHCENASISLLDAFCGSGALLSYLGSQIPRSAGYEPSKEVFGAGQEMMGVQDRVSCHLPEVQGLDILCLFDGFTSLLKPESLLTLLSPSTLILECPIFDLEPKKLPFWQHAKPREHARYYSRHGLAEALGHTGYVVKEDNSAFPIGYEGAGDKALRILVAKPE